MQTMLWTADGDLARGSADEIISGSGPTALTNHIYFLLRQAAAGLSSGFNILKYVGKTPTPVRLGELRTELSTFLNANLNMPEPVSIVVNKLDKAIITIAIYSTRTGSTSTSSSFSYKNGSWNIDTPILLNTNPAEEPDNIPNTLLDR